MGQFDNIENAQVDGKLPPIAPGMYLLEVQNIKVVNTRKAGNAFISEFKVLESTNPAFPKGSSCSHFIKMSLDSAMGNIKGYVAALTGEPNVTSQIVDNLVSGANPAKGHKVRAEAYIIKTKAGADFTKVTYANVPE